MFAFHICGKSHRSKLYDRSSLVCLRYTFLNIWRSDSLIQIANEKDIVSCYKCRYERHKYIFIFTWIWYNPGFVPRDCLRGWISILYAWNNKVNLRLNQNLKGWWNVGCTVILKIEALQWPHNEHNDVSNHHRLDRLFNHLFRRRWKKTLKIRVTGLCGWNSPHDGAVTRKMVPSDDVIMVRSGLIIAKPIRSDWHTSPVLQIKCMN